MAWPCSIWKKLGWSKALHPAPFFHVHVAQQVPAGFAHTCVAERFCSIGFTKPLPSTATDIRDDPKHDWLGTNFTEAFPMEVESNLKKTPRWCSSYSSWNCLSLWRVSTSSHRLARAAQRRLFILDEWLNWQDLLPVDASDRIFDRILRRRKHRETRIKRLRIRQNLSAACSPWMV